jgi:ADP-heptose:LPS heptosyltransferase
MPGSRAPLRLKAVTLAVARWGVPRRRPDAPRRILVLHHLLLGDTLMVTALLAKLRERHPGAAIVMTVAPAIAPLYAGRPYGVDVVALDPRDVASARPLFDAPRFDVAYLPADNRWSWLARALGIRWIVGIAGDRPAHKNWPVDERVPYSVAPTAFCDTAAELVAGPAPAPFRPAHWPAPACADPPAVAGRYAVLHVGAGSPLKQWEPARWRALAAWLEARGLAVVWSAGPGEAALVDAVDGSDAAQGESGNGDGNENARSAGPKRTRFAGSLSLAALWHLLARAALLVVPDTGIAHLGRIVGVPTVTLYGPGSATICGPGEFFAGVRCRAVTVDPFPCRDQTVQFFRDVPWARRCERLPGAPPDRCSRARCMEAIDVAAVVAAIGDLGVVPPERGAAN